MARRLAAVAFLAPDYDQAIAWFREALGFALLEDAALGGGKRWVVVGPADGAGARHPGRCRIRPPSAAASRRASGSSTLSAFRRGSTLSRPSAS